MNITDLPAPAREATEGAVSPETFRQRILDRLTYQVGGSPERASKRDWFLATALATRDLVMDHWRSSNADTLARGDKRVCYL
ncbi:hypothetical protein RQ832_17345, partial [Roseomonas sp. DSM 102946]|nr:hypothetical protein [Roseomonas sp. DSM 102946]